MFKVLISQNFAIIPERMRIFGKRTCWTKSANPEYIHFQNGNNNIINSSVVGY